MVSKESVAAAVEAWFLHAAGRVHEVTPLGESAGIGWWRIESERGCFVARTMDARYEVRAIPFEVFAARYLAERTPLVPEALLTAEGRSFGEGEGQALVLFAAASGEPVGPGYSAVRVVGEALATVHGAGLDFGPPPRPGHPSWEFFDWELNEPWTWIDLERACNRLARSGGDSGARLANALPFLRAARDEISGWLEAVRDNGPAFGLVHGNPAPGTVRVHDGSPSAITDWRRCRGDWLVVDLAVAVWEFARHPGTAAPDPHLASQLVEAYVQAGGPMPIDDVRWLAGMVRAELLRRLCELAYLSPELLLSAGDLIRGIEAIDASVPLVVPRNRPGG